MSTCNLYFGAKIRKIGLPPHTPVLLYKCAVQGGIHYNGHVFVMMTTCSRIICTDCFSEQNKNSGNVYILV